MPNVIKLRSSDGEVFEVDVEVARASNTIRTMLEDLYVDGNQDVVLLPSVNSALLKKVIQWSTQNSSSSSNSSNRDSSSSTSTNASDLATTTRSSGNATTINSNMSASAPARPSPSNNRLIQPSSQSSTNVSNQSARHNLPVTLLATAGTNTISNNGASNQPCSNGGEEPRLHLMQSRSVGAVQSVSSTPEVEHGDISKAGALVPGAGATTTTNLPAIGGASFRPSPEILFLVREHAKTISAISSISKRLDQLEVKVCDIQKNVTQSKSAAAMVEPKASTSNSSVPGNVLSDDSGGEYSRTTTGTNTDEDELLSLLDQIAKCSQQIRETQQAQLSQQYVLLNSLPTARESALGAVAGVGGGGGGLMCGYDNFSLLGSTRQLTVPSVSGRDFQLHPVHLPAPSPQIPMMVQMSSSQVPTTLLHQQQLLHRQQHLRHQLQVQQQQQQQLQQQQQQQQQQFRNQSSLSALLDPNVDRFLNNLHQELSSDDRGPPQEHHQQLLPSSSAGYVASNQFALPLGASTPLHSSTTSSRELLMQSAASASVAAAAAVASSGVGNNSSSNSSSSSTMGGGNWRMDRARQLVRQREQEEAESQLDLAEQWLASHIKKTAAQQRHNPH